jgi:hypothetical protein
MSSRGDASSDLQYTGPRTKQINISMRVMRVGASGLNFYLRLRRSISVISSGVRRVHIVSCT